MNKARIIMFILAAAMLLFTASCGGIQSGTGGVSVSSVTETAIDKDREGNPITLPREIDRIIAMGPSNNEILIALGCGDKIIAADEYSAEIPGLASGIPLFSMLTPDGEQIVNLEPDVIFVTGMSKMDGDDPLQIINDAGICVVYMPSSSSIEGVKEDIRYLAAVMDKQPEGGAIIAEMEREIDEICEIARTVENKKTVYFEIEAAPYMYSFGKGTFLNEMLELLGAKNILFGQESWVSVAEEAVLNANPDVILTSVDYIDDPIGEIKARPGWSEIAAVKNNDVYYIDTDASNRPSQNIVKALREIAKAVHPDKY